MFISIYHKCITFCSFVFVMQKTMETVEALLVRNYRCDISVLYERSSKRRCNNLRDSTTDNHSVCTATSVCARRAPVALKKTLLRRYGDLTATPLRSFQNAERRRLFCVCSKCALSIGVLCDPKASAGDATALLRRYFRS
jgi:hypothetical protein